MISSPYSFSVEPGTVHMVDFLVEESAGVPLNLAGWTASFKATTRPDGGVTVLDFTSATNRLNIVPAEGRITLTIEPGDLVLPVAVTGRALSYNLEINDGAGTVYRPFRGTIALTPRV